MATALPSNSDLECSICFESYKTPKILSCGHSFCLKCLVEYIDGRKWAFSCPVCQQHVEIPRGGVDKFITNFSLQTSMDSQRTTVISTAQPSTSLKPKHYCPNHSKKEVEYYCQTCSLGLCSKCIYIDHNDHKTLDLECDSTKEKVFQELSKSVQFLNNKIEDLEKTHAALLETSEKLKSFCNEACTKISEKTSKIIVELKQNCEKRQKDIRNNFDKNESKLTETRQKLRTQIKNMETDLETSRPTTEEPSLTLVYSLTKLQHLQKLCENMKTDIPQVTYVEWKEGSVNVCDILGSTVTKPLRVYQSSEGSRPMSTVTKPLYQSSENSYSMSTVTKPLYQSSESSRPISTVTKPPYQSSAGNVFKCNYFDIKKGNLFYYSKDRCKSHGMVWRCSVLSDGYNVTKCFYINIELIPEDNPRVKSCIIEHTVTILNKDKDKHAISRTMTGRFKPGEWRYGINLPWYKLMNPSEGFVDNEGQFLVKFDILLVSEKEIR